MTADRLIDEKPPWPKCCGKLMSARICRLRTISDENYGAEDCSSWFECDKCGRHVEEQTWKVPPR